MDAFILWKDISSDGAVVYYGKLSNPLQIVKTSIYGAQTLLGDGVMVWRCYVVFDKKKWIPAVFGPFIIASLVAIAYRIFSRGRETNVQRSVLPVAGIIIQSGSLYASGVLVMLITYLAGTNGQYVALDICTPLVGIAFVLIILQIRFRNSLSNGSHQASADGSSGLSGRYFTSHSSRTRRSRGIGVRADPSYGMNSYPMQVTITEERQNFDGLEMPKLDGQARDEGGSSAFPFERKETVIKIGAKNGSHDSDLDEP
ncbi:hypothetical protein EW146_g7000 [Bondarzewia mesenterica]|uniref:Uncharacterized protein n=1 Tax=Bondarzewia mesenterica TaxID=1095465 RepID=A0A4S4LM58_9AGAM|nr:hypothetical protein EW146_g7000 [Bondarzewia mesenterica]